MEKIGERWHTCDFDATAIEIEMVMRNDYEVLCTNILRAIVGRFFIMFDMDAPYFPIHNL